MKDEYPDSKSDLFAAFIERCATLALPGGTAAMITMQSWMFLSSYQKLRTSLLIHQQISSMIHLGARAFDSIGGEVVSSTAFVLVNQLAGSQTPVVSKQGVFLRLVDGASEAEKTAALHDALDGRDGAPNYYLASAADFAAIPGSPIVYWLSEKMRAAFKAGRPLGHVAAPRKGIDTGENAEFLRMWWEVSRRKLAVDGASDGKWLPYNKGGGFRRWYGNREVVVNWEFDGAAIRARRDWTTRKPTLRNLDFMKREGYSWGTVSSGGFSARYTPPGALFDNGGCTLFVDQGLDRFGALLNSTTNDFFLGVLAPTLNFQPGDLALVPLAPRFESFDVGIAECVSNEQDDYDLFEESWDFSRNPLILRAIGGRD